MFVTIPPHERFAEPTTARLLSATKTFACNGPLSSSEEGKADPYTNGLFAVRSRLHDLRLWRVGGFLYHIGVLFAGEVHVGEVLLCGG